MARPLLFRPSAHSARENTSRQSRLYDTQQMLTAYQLTNTYGDSTADLVSAGIQAGWTLVGGAISASQAKKQAEADAAAAKRAQREARAQAKAAAAAAAQTQQTTVRNVGLGVLGLAVVGAAIYWVKRK